MSLRRRGGKSKDASQTAVSDIPKATHEREVDPGIRPSHAASSLVDYSFILSLVLGGCCANVWAYEQLLNINPRIGSALTFSQTLFITVQTLPQFLTWSLAPRATWLPSIKARQVPVRQWIFQVLVHTAGSLLNNWAFAFRVPLTIQIVFRSAGLAVSMLFGYFFLDKLYTRAQITSVCLASLGVILTTLSRPSSPSKRSTEDLEQYIIGISMLTISLLLTGVLGMLQELTYRKYGPCWREGVFYTHFLSLPIFLFLVPDIKQGLGSLSTPSSSFSSPYIILAGNLITQLICVSGVNRLSSQVSSVSTNLVLTTRKAISLCFSVWWFGNGWNTQLGVGAAMVFVGSLLFTLQ